MPNVIEVLKKNYHVVELQYAEVTMIRMASIIALVFAIGNGVAIAEEAAEAPATALSGTGGGVSAGLTAQELLSYCVYNGKVFSPGVEICVRKGFAYKCNPATKDKEAQWSAVPNTCANGTELPPP